MSGKRPDSCREGYYNAIDVYEVDRFDSTRCVTDPKFKKSKQ